MDTSRQLLAAARNGRLEEVERLIQNGAPLDTKSKGGQRSPLHYAVIGSHLLMVECLVKAGAPLNATDNEKWTPLHYATFNSYLLITKVLLESGADYTICNNKGKTAKDLSRGKKEIVELLQQYEDAPDVKEPDCC